MTRVLLVNHGLSKACGIYAHGIRMRDTLCKSTVNEIVYVECNSISDLINHVSRLSPNVVIYNQSPAVMPWVSHIRESCPNVLHLGMTHDVTQDQMDLADPSPFNFRIALDPTLKENSKWFTSVRPLFGYTGKFSNVRNNKLILGSFGFYFRHKNFDRVIALAHSLQKPVNLRLHITKAYFSSDDVKKEFDDFVLWADKVTQGSNVKLEINQTYLSDTDLIDELSKNDLNILLYNTNYGAGPSSAVDYCVAAGRPLLLSNSYQFRHVQARLPSIMDTDVDSAIKLGPSEILKIRDEWSSENFLKDYERIIHEVQNR